MKDALGQVGEEEAAAAGSLCRQSNKDLRTDQKEAATKRPDLVHLHEQKGRKSVAKH